MSSGTSRHDLASEYLMTLIRQSALEEGCRPYNGNRLLRVSAATAYVLDILVVCGPRADEHYEADAILVVEVLSQSTRSTDKREKLEAYGRLPSLRQYTLVEPTVRRIEVAMFSGPERIPAWSAYGPGSAVDLGRVVVDLDAYYDEVDREDALG